MDKEKQLLFIKKFAKIKLSKLCRKYNVDYSNLVKGHCDKIKVNAIANDLQNELNLLIFEYLKG